MAASIKLTIASHHFKVEVRTEAAKAVIFEFVRRFVKVDIQGNNRTITTFAAANKARSWFRFHINALEDFYMFARNRNYPKESMEIVTRPYIELKKVDLPLQPQWKVREDQVDLIEYLTRPVAAHEPKAKLVGLQTGGGKALPKEAKIRTPDGWVLNKDLKVGDTILAWDGTPSKVDGIFDQGVIDACRLKFDDGRQVVCSWDHLWRMYVDNDPTPLVCTARDMESYLLRGKGVRIDLHTSASPEQVSALMDLVKGKEHPTVPYMYTLRPKSQEDLNAWTETAWAAGARAHGIQVAENKWLLYVMVSDGSFHTQTTAVVSIRSDVRQEMQCISIDHPDKLFITDNWIVTHNTFTSVKALSDLGYKVACVVKPKYIANWVESFSGKEKGILALNPKEVMVIQGSSALQALTEMAITPGALDKYKIFIFSNRSFDNYIKAYELLGSSIDTMGYMVNPDELFEKLGVGIRLVDEVHEEFHANFRLDLYTHVHMSISLSATLISRDPVLSRMYEVAYPFNTRYKAPPLKKYTTAYGIYYRNDPNYRIRTSERGQSSYSHNAYEASVLKNPTFTYNYCQMVKHYLDKGFVSNYEKGNKAIVFASTVDMCTKMSEKLSEWYPQYTVKRYVAADDYQSNYQDPDIRVTTIGSGGTGHDIKNLTDAHLTNNIDSIQANIQAMGRLRDLGSKETRFWWYTNLGVPKHVNYHKKKEKLMDERAKSHCSVDYHKTL